MNPLAEYQLISNSKKFSRLTIKSLGRLPAEAFMTNYNNAPREHNELI